MTRWLTTETPGLRTEINDALSQLVTHWTEPGQWFTATERLAMASLVRMARAATGIPPWQSPRTVPRLIDPDNPLDDAVVDLVWRLTNHPGTLTHDWYLKAIEDGLHPGAYVELVGVVAMANTLEHFCHAIGADSPALPSPSISPAASGNRIPGAVSSHWVPTVDSDLTNIRKALSAAPAEASMQVVLLDAMYVPGGALAVGLEERIWSLERTQVELVASRVSSLNECFY